MSKDNDLIKLDPIVRDQILKVRDTGETNMFDTNGVMRVAYEYDYHELVCYLAEKSNQKDYIKFILLGDTIVDDSESGDENA